MNKRKIVCCSNIEIDLFVGYKIILVKRFESLIGIPIKTVNVNGF